MKKHRLTACALAALLATAPLIAACDPVTDEIIEVPGVPEEEIPAVPEQPEETPVAPEETPDIPEELPEEEPETPIVPDVPEDEEEDVPVVNVQAQYVLSHANGLNVRTGAGTGYASLGQINSGDMLHFVRREGNWYETRYRGKTAYVSADSAYTSMAFLDKADDKIEAVIAEGLELLGVPYVYGATRLHDGKGNFLKGFSTNAFDY